MSSRPGAQRIPNSKGYATHKEPANLPKMTGPFATPSSRAGGGGSGGGVRRTSLGELKTVSLERLYAGKHLQVAKSTVFKADVELNRKIALWRGDITTAEVDALVNAANRKLLGGGGVDGAIHRAAGEELTATCKKIPVKAVRRPPAAGYDVRIEAGECVITPGFRLPAKHVIHTVGPDLRLPLRMGNLPATPEAHKKQLQNCYQGALELTVKHDLKSVAFSAVSVGVFGYNPEDATRLALSTVRTFLESDAGKTLETVVFTVFDQKIVDIYARLVPEYFPPPSSAGDS